MTNAQQSTLPKPSPAAARFKELSARAKQAQENIGKAAAESRAELSTQVHRTRQATDRSTAALKSAVTATKGKAAENWESIQDTWNSLTTEAHAKAHAQAQDRHPEDPEAWAIQDAARAEHRADRAERHALDAIEFASALVQESEYATLDAVLARMDADDAALNTH